MSSWTKQAWFLTARVLCYSEKDFVDFVLRMLWEEWDEVMGTTKCPPVNLCGRYGARNLTE